MKKYFLAILIFFSFSSIFSAQENLQKEPSPAFHIELNSSYCNETRNYYVIETTGKTNSLLEWNADYLFKEGITGGMKIGNWELNLSTQFCLPFECGKMYDSDWYVPQIKTNLSKSDLFTAFGNDTKLTLKYSFELGKTGSNFFVSPVVFISNSFIRLEARNTIGWCGDMGHTHLDQHYPWNSEYAKKVKKYGINLTNNITSVFCGAELKKQFGPLITNIGALISPFTYIFSIDHHLNKEEGNYYQMIQKALFKAWDFYGGIGYSINNKNTILLGADYNICPVIPGELYYGYYKIDHIIADETSRFSYNIFSLTLSWQYLF